MGGANGTRSKRRVVGNRTVCAQTGGAQGGGDLLISERESVHADGETGRFSHVLDYDIFLIC